MRFRYGEIFNYHFTSNSLLSRVK